MNVEVHPLSVEASYEAAVIADELQIPRCSSKQHFLRQFSFAMECLSNDDEGDLVLLKEFDGNGNLLAFLLYDMEVGETAIIAEHPRFHMEYAARLFRRARYIKAQRRAQEKADVARIE
jgi:hypothetical protein